MKKLEAPESEAQPFARGMDLENVKEESQKILPR